MREKRAFKVLFFVWLGCFLALIYMPRLPRVRVNFFEGWLRLDYLAHFGFNVILIYLFLLWRSNERYRTERWQRLRIFAAGVAFCLFTEYTQHLIVPMRAFEYQDLACNLAGMAAGFTTFVLCPPEHFIKSTLHRKNA